MKIMEACQVISRVRGDSVLVSTMRAMYAFDKLGEGQPRLSAVPLMGGAPSLGLGIALAKPQCKVIVVDGDASLLMQLGGLVTVATQNPKNLYHFVMHNGTQFTGISNLPLPAGDSVDFVGLARSAGYKQACVFSNLEEFKASIDGILRQDGPVFIALRVEPDPPSYPEKPLKDFAEHHFTRMGDEARQLSRALASR